MIPYVEWHTINIGPVHLQVWGLFVGLGFLFGAYMAAGMAKQRGQDPKIVYDLLPWLVLAGLIGGRLGYVLFYDLSHFIEYPLEMFALWQGGSSMFGGLIACLIVGLGYLRYRKVDLMLYSDILIFGLPFGIWIGRIGCFLIHDHPGTATDFFLGTKFPDGVVRHDLGLYESLAGLAMSVVFLWLVRKPRPTGTYLAAFAISYGLFRFGFDFIRINDVRYFGLTPAQYLCFASIAVGLGILMWIRAGLKKA
mgnify:CR=1 FL=1